MHAAENVWTLMWNLASSVALHINDSNLCIDALICIAHFIISLVYAQNPTHSKKNQF